MKFCRVLQCLNGIVGRGLVSLAFSTQVRYVHCSNIERNNSELAVPESRSDWQINCDNEMSRVIIAANFNSTQQMSQILFPSKLKFSNWSSLIRYKICTCCFSVENLCIENPGGTCQISASAGFSPTVLRTNNVQLPERQKAVTRRVALEYVIKLFFRLPIFWSKSRDRTRLSRAKLSKGVETTQPVFLLDFKLFNTYSICKNNRWYNGSGGRTVIYIRTENIVRLKLLEKSLTLSEGFADRHLFPFIRVFVKETLKKLGTFLMNFNS